MFDIILHYSTFRTGSTSVCRRMPSRILGHLRGDALNPVGYVRQRRHEIALFCPFLVILTVVCGYAFGVHSIPKFNAFARHEFCKIAPVFRPAPSRFMLRCWFGFGGRFWLVCGYRRRRPSLEHMLAVKAKAGQVSLAV